MSETLRLRFTEEELAEIYFAMEYAEENHVYGRPEVDPWNREEAKAFQAAFKKIKRLAKPDSVPV